MKIDKKTFKVALKASLPIILGYLPTGFAFGLMITSIGYHVIWGILMSVVMYAGAGQYLAVDLIKENAGLLQVGLLIFLINSKHLFYGLSLLEDYRNTGKKKFYLIFSLTDETYAVLTGPSPAGVDRNRFCLYVSLLNQSGWVMGTILGGLLGSLVSFPTDGLEFAMTALFLVIAIEQWKTARSKLPFFIGITAGLVALFLFGPANILLGGACIGVTTLLLCRRRLETQ